MKTTIKFFVAAIAMLATGFTSMAQDRDAIRSTIEEVGHCRNVAITANNGDIALFGENEYIAQGCPEDLLSVLNQLHEEGHYIDDVQLTEKGRWVVLVNNNDAVYGPGLPETLIDALKYCNENDMVVLTIAINDSGDWILGTKENDLTSSDDEMTQWLAAMVEKYGTLYTACLTEDNLIATFERGFASLTDIQEDLLKALQETDMDVIRLKVASDGAWFFADAEGKNNYKM